jgi:hypothetical protein
MLSLFDSAMTPADLKPFADALYLQGKLIALLGLDPDAQARHVEARVKELIAAAALVSKPPAPP